MQSRYCGISLFVIVHLLFSVTMPTTVFAEPDKDGDKEERRLVHMTSSVDKILLKSLGCKIMHELHDAIAIKCPKGLSIQNSFVDEVYHVMDINADVQINADDVWALGYTGSGITVAVLDTGIDTDHPEIADSIVGGKGFGYATSEDDHGHGTHVAGIITGNGVAQSAKGVAPDAMVWMGKVCNASGSCYSSDIAAGIEYVVNGPDGTPGTGDEPARIMSISLGGGGTSGSNCDTDFLANKVNWAVSNGATVVVAAGNTAGKVSSPGCASKAIAVGAVDKNDIRASWSGTGSALDIAAPGVSIYSSIIGGYASWSGTSMATPHVSGVVALLRQLNSALTDVQIKDALYKTAKDLGSAGLDTYYGWGRVDALAALQYVQPPAPVHDVAVTNIQSPSYVMHGTTASVSVTVVNEGTFDEPFMVKLTDTTNNYFEIGSQSVTLTAGSSQVLAFSWDTGGASFGYHTLKAETLLSGDADTLDNARTALVEVKDPAALPNLHVGDITMSIKGSFYKYARATVTIYDANNQPVSGATVYGHWSGATSDSDSGTTNSSGKVTLNSNSIRKPSGTTYTFCVDNVVKTGWIYNSVANIEVCDSIKT